MNGAFSLKIVRGDQPPLAEQTGHWPWASFLAVTLLALIPAAPVGAQNQYSSTSMWGSAPGGVSVPGSLESASAHYFNGIVAGQVNSARNGLLTDGTALSIQTIGSQNITTMTVNGSGNENLEIDAEQDSSNSGDVQSDATIESNW